MTVALIWFDFLWNLFVGLAAMMCSSLTLGAYSATLGAIAVWRGLKEKRALAGIILGVAWTAGFAALAWWCFSKAGFKGFWIGFIFPGILTIAPAAYGMRREMWKFLNEGQPEPPGGPPR